MAERRPIIAANWKMHKTHLEAIQAVQKLSYLLDHGDAERVEVVICPPFTALRSVQTLIDSDKLPYGLGAQDVHPEEQGALTGEVSPLMLQALKVAYVIVGHSERRQLFGEDDVLINKKLRSVFAHSMTPMLCVGETLEEGDAGRVVELIRGTLAGSYDDGLAAGIRVQYGGSVKPGNIREFMAHPEIDGALVGGASLDPEEFALIVKYR